MLRGAINQFMGKTMGCGEESATCARVNATSALFALFQRANKRIFGRRGALIFFRGRPLRFAKSFRINDFILAVLLIRQRGRVCDDI